MLPESFWGRIVYLLQQYGPSFLKGAGVSLWLALVGTLFGCIIRFVVGIIQTIPVDKNDSPVKRVIIKVIKFIMACYVEFFRGTPMMAQAMFIYFGSSYLFEINMSMWFAAILIVSINTGAYMAETVRGGILSIDEGQTEGAKAIGMTHVQTMVNVILPQALRNIMPQIGNNLIINIKDTCVLSIIGTVELFYTTKGVAGALYTYFESFTIAMVIYFVMTFTCSRLLRLLERKMDGPDNYDLATTDTLAGAMNLVAAGRQHVDVHSPGIYSVFSESLNGIYMEIRLRRLFPDQIPDLLHRLHRTDFIVDMHHRYKNRLRSQSLLQGLHLYHSKAVHRQNNYVKALIRQPPRGSGYRRMLHRGDQNPVSPAPVGHGGSHQGPVVGFRSSGGKINFLFLHLQNPGQLRCRLPEVIFRLHPLSVHGGRIPVIFRHNPDHQIRGFSAAAGGSRMI